MINYDLIANELNGIDVFGVVGGFDSAPGHALRIMVAQKLGKEATKDQKAAEWPMAVNWFVTKLSAEQQMAFIKKYFKKYFKKGA